jgi:GNAT superfamily N-acetyltransferase
MLERGGWNLVNGRKQTKRTSWSADQIADGKKVPQLLNIREAFPEEAGLSSDLALLSKAHWGYSQDFLDSCRSELTVSPAQISSDCYQYLAAVEGDVIIGFYALERLSDNDYELEALFVAPEHIGTGIGRALIAHAKRMLFQRGAARLIIQGDPNATQFYVAAGGRQVGTRESASIPGRHLPLFEIEIGSN